MGTLSGDDIIPCYECGAPKPRCQYHTPHDCVRYLKSERERLRAELESLTRGIGECEGDGGCRATKYLAGKIARPLERGQ